MGLSQIVNSSETLKYAQSFSFTELPNELAAIKLEFETFSCFISVVEVTDEIELTENNKLGGLVKGDSSLLFHKCYGLKLCWAWSLVNNQGYSDGLRFEFENNQKVELVVCASAILQYGDSEL